MAYRPPHQPGQSNFNASGNQQPRPGNAQFMQPRSFAGVAPQRYPMMQPGMGPGGYTPQMYQGQVPPQGVMGMGAAMGYPQQQQGAQQMMGQQPYSGQQMAQQQQGTNPMVEQQKRMMAAQQQLTEKQKKERYLEEQRRKLQKFSKGGTAALGTAKLDFDNLLGTSGKEAAGRGGSATGRTAMQPQIQPKVAEPAADDSFGDFLQGPTNAPPGNPAPTGATSSTQEEDFGDFLQGPTSAAHPREPTPADASKTAVSQPQGPGDNAKGVEGTGSQEVAETQKTQETKPSGPTLETMMMASTDFSSSKAQKTKPTKRTLRDSQPQAKHPPSSQPTVPKFESSQKSHVWTAGAQNYTGLFDQGLPGVPSGPQSAAPVVPSVAGRGDEAVDKQSGKYDGGKLPAWCLNERAIPLIYYQVLEACVRDGAIQTELVYPILILSGLDKAVLGHIWNMANRTTPGRLIKHELFFALGMIALAQNGQPLNTEVTSSLKEAPVPNLTPSANDQTGSQTSTQTIEGSVLASSAGHGGDDEFADFQAATPRSGHLPMTMTQSITTPLPSTSVAPSLVNPGAAVQPILLPSSRVSKPPPAASSSSKSSSKSSKSKSGIPTVSLSTMPASKSSGGGSAKTTGSNSGGALKLGDMGKIEDVGFDPRYPKEEENCYIFAGSPPESGSSGRSSPLVWDPNCIYDKLTIRSKDDSESTSSLSDRTPIEEDDEEQFDDFKSAPSADPSSIDLTGFQMTGKMDKRDSDSDSSSGINQFVFEKVRIKHSPMDTKDPPSIPPPHGGSKESTVDDFNMSMSSGSQLGQAQSKLNKFASFDSSAMSSSSTASVLPKPPQPVAPNEFSEFKKAGVIKMETTFSAFNDSPKKSISITDFTPFQGGKLPGGALPKAKPAHQSNFADFSNFKHSASESDLMGMTPGQADKYAALRDLTSDAATSEPEFGLAATPEALDEDEFEDFQQAEPAPNTSVQGSSISGVDSMKQPSIGTATLGLSLDTNVPPSASSLDDSFADFQQAETDPSDLFGSAPSEMQKPSLDLTSKPMGLGNMGMKPLSLLGTGLMPASKPPPGSWLDNVPLDREPPDDDFGDFQTTSEPFKTTPDTLSIGKSDDSGSLNDFKKAASASDLYGMEFDSFGAVNDEDAPRTPALDLDDQPTPDEPPKPIDPAMVFSSHSSGKLPKVNNIASLDLTTLDLDLGNGNGQGDEKREDRSGSFGDFSSAPVMPAMDINSQEPNKSADMLSNPVPSGGMTVSSAPLVPQGSALIGDRYSQVSGEIQDDHRHAHEWRRCLESCYASIKKANNVFNGISSSTVCNEVIRSTEGSDYLTAVIEIYRVACRIVTSMKAMGAETEDLQELEKDIDLVWNNLSAFLAASPLQPDDGSFVFKTAVLKPEPGNKDRACGVCLLNVDSRSKAFDHSKDNHKLSYGGRQYHATCANLWVNMVDSILPALPLDSLL